MERNSKCDDSYNTNKDIVTMMNTSDTNKKTELQTHANDFEFERQSNLHQRCYVNSENLKLLP